MILQKILFYLKRNKNIKLEYSNLYNDSIKIELLYKSPIYELYQSITNIKNSKEINKDLIDFLNDEKILKSNILVFNIKVEDRNIISDFILNTLSELINNNLNMIKKSNTEFIVYGNYISFKNLSKLTTNTEDLVLYKLSEVYKINTNPVYYNIDINRYNEILNHINNISLYHIYVIDYYSIDNINNYISFITDNSDIIKVIKESDYRNNIIEYKSYFIVSISQKDIFNIIKENYMINNSISSDISDELHIIIKEILKNITLYDYINDNISIEDINEENNSQYYKDIDEIIE